MNNDKKKQSYLIRIPILSIDLLVTGLIYLLLMSRYSPVSLFNSPTSAELGYNLSSPEIVNEQIKIVMLGVIIWVTYALSLGLAFGKSLGHMILGTKFNPHNNSRIKIGFSVLLSPLILFDSVLGIEIIRSRNKTTLSKLATALASLTSVATLPAFIFYIFIAGLVILAPRNDNVGNSTLCGEKFCTVKAYDTCEQNLDLVRSRVVEILGKNFTGTGFLLSDSLVLTNYHVVAQENILSIREQNGRVSQAQIYNANQDLDIAILVGQFTSGEHIQFVNPQDFGEGTTDLYAIGYPSSVLRQAGTGSVTVTSGIYSSFLDYHDYGFQLVQTDAAVNPGNSGGPLVNKCGQVFGMVTLSEKYDAYTGDVKEGLNYAISSTTLVSELNRLSN